MAKVTITEALAELKTIGKRLEKKREFVMQFLHRQDMVRDPHEKDGGSIVAVANERRSIADLEERTIRIRAAIADANRATTITSEGQTRSISDWLSWRRDVAPGQQAFLKKMLGHAAGIRDAAMKKGLQVNPAETARQPVDIIINFDERALATEAEKLETVLGTLDGQLSLKNATIVVDIAD